MKIKKILLMIIGMMLFTIYFMPTISADTMPKPYVHTTLKNLNEAGIDTCYVTYLSKTDSYGPYTVDYNRYEEESEEEQLIDQKFAGFVDKDGYYYLHYFGKCDQSNDTFKWNYYPPKYFKILIYVPTTDTLICIDSLLEQSTFETYLNVDMMNYQTEKLEVVQEYNYTKQTLSFFIRLLICLIVELLIALLFHYKKTDLIFIGIVNIATQIFLNIIINITWIKEGIAYVYLELFILEFFIFLFEGVAYSIGLPLIKQKLDKKEEDKKKNNVYELDKQLGQKEKKKYWNLSMIIKCVLYSLAANACSIVAGIIILSF